MFDLLSARVRQPQAGVYSTYICLWVGLIMSVNTHRHLARRMINNFQVCFNVIDQHGHGLLPIVIICKRKEGGKESVKPQSPYSVNVCKHFDSLWPIAHFNNRVNALTTKYLFIQLYVRVCASSSLPPTPLSTPFDCFRPSFALLWMHMLMLMMSPHVSHENFRNSASSVY